MLRPDGSLASFQAAGTPTVYRGDRLPKELYGNVFVAEPAATLTAAVTQPDRQVVADATVTVVFAGVEYHLHCKSPVSGSRAAFIRSNKSFSGAPSFLPAARLPSRLKLDGDRLGPMIDALERAVGH